MKSKWVKRLLTASVSLSMLVGAPASELVSLSALAAVEETALEEAGTDLEEQDLETSGSDEEEVKEDTEVKTEPEEVSETIEANTEAIAEVNPEEPETEAAADVNTENEEIKNTEVNPEVTDLDIPEENSVEVPVAESQAGEEESALADSVTDEESATSFDEEEYEVSTFEVESDNEEATDASDDTKTAVLENQKNRARTNGNANDSSNVNRKSIHDGAILHVFSWNFDTVIENMDEIAAAGFTAIQTSPINKVIDTHPALTLSGEGQWYYHYQPTDWTIGNYQLGDREGFKALCDKADEYGIGVIVDIDPNHTTPSKSELSQNLLDAVGGIENLYHKDNNSGMDYSNRLSVTYDDMGGLPDVDTENPDFQEYFYAYLEDCINCGADGFRIDTAKHIALPDDAVSKAYENEPDRNNFYPNMVKELSDYAAETGRKDYSNLFVYGEVLQGAASRLSSYQEAIGGTTASNYGGTIRSALANDNFNVGKVSDYGISAEDGRDAYPDKLVTWVESHDNYINDTSYTSINDQDTILGWAVITARKDGTPLFFSRPAGSTKDKPFGNNVLGAAGNDLFKSAEVTAINKFRTAMVGKDEILSNPGNDNHIILIERKDADAQNSAGAVLVNSASTSLVVEGKTSLEDGTYVNAIEGKDDIFTVSNGIISGIVKAEDVVVLREKADVSYTTVHFYNTENWSNVNAKIEGQDALVSGINETDGWVRFYIPEGDVKVSFTDGINTTGTYDVNNGKDNYITPAKTDIFGSVQEAEAALGIKTESVYFFNTVLWDDVKVYSWLNDETKLAGEWPGKSTTDEGGYWIRADLKIPESVDEPFYVIFSGASGAQTDNILIDDDNRYIAISEETKTSVKYASKEDAEKAMGLSANMTTVHFYNADNWDKVYVHMWEAYDTGAWPGKLAEDEGDGWWKFEVPAAVGSDFNIIFNSGDGKQTENLKVTDLLKRYIVGNKYYSSKEIAISSGENTTIYYYDDNNWDAEEVYAYIWSSVEGYNNTVGNWPGTQMTSLGNGFYSLEVSNDAILNGDLNLIFNQKGSNQLSDKKIRDTKKVYFNTKEAEGYENWKDALGDRDVEIPGTDEGTPSTEAPSEEPATGGETPSTETPSEEAPATGGETPSTETPSEEAPATGGETPSTETPSQTAPSTGAPTQTVPETQVPTGSTPSTEVKTPAVETPQVNTPEEGKTETVKTEEKVAVTGITLEKKIKVGKGGKYQLTAVVAPANATNTEIEWTTSDKKIATVSNTGLVKAKKKGSATITATTRDGGFKAEVKVIVKDAIKVTGVKLNKKSKTIKVGKSYTLKATIKPKKATITDVTWSSSNKKVAKVDKEGNVTAIGKGTATITVKTKDGKYTATCKITVKK